MSSLYNRKMQRKGEGRKPFTFRELQQEAIAVERQNLERLHFLSQQQSIDKSRAQVHTNYVSTAPEVEPQMLMQSGGESNAHLVEQARKLGLTHPLLDPNQISVPYYGHPKTDLLENEFLLQTPRDLEPGYVNVRDVPRLNTRPQQQRMAFDGYVPRRAFRANDRKLQMDQLQKRVGGARPKKVHFVDAEDEPSSVETPQEAEESGQGLDEEIAEYLTMSVQSYLNRNQQQRPLRPAADRSPMLNMPALKKFQRVLLEEGPPRPLKEVGGDDLPLWMLPILANVDFGQCLKCGRPGHRYNNPTCSLADKPMYSRPCTSCGHGLHNSANCINTAIQAAEAEAGESKN